MLGCHIISETSNEKIVVCLHLRPVKVTCSLHQFHPHHLMLAMMEVSFAWYMVHRNPTNHLLQTLNTTVVVLWTWYIRTLEWGQGNLYNAMFHKLYFTNYYYGEYAAITCMLENVKWYLGWNMSWEQFIWETLRKMESKEMEWMQLTEDMVQW